MRGMQHYIHMLLRCGKYKTESIGWTKTYQWANRVNSYSTFCCCCYPSLTRLRRRQKLNLNVGSDCLQCLRMQSTKYADRSKIDVWDLTRRSSSSHRGPGFYQRAHASKPVDSQSAIIQWKLMLHYFNCSLSHYLCYSSMMWIIDTLFRDHLQTDTCFETYVFENSIHSYFL